MTQTSAEIQSSYYEKTAELYDGMHTGYGDDEHYSALRFVHAIADALQIKHLLDVGTGTGRGLSFLLNHGRFCYGIEPVEALLRRAENRNIPKGLLIQGNGYNLPLANSSIDAVLECGVLHHVAEPKAVVSEMLRVAKKAVFLSDSNRFGQGSRAARIAKLLLYKAHLWRAARFIQTGGKMYKISAGDGLAYSYSVYDSYRQVAEWASEVWIIPTGGIVRSSSWFHPLLTSSHVLLCGIKR